MRPTTLTALLAIAVCGTATAQRLATYDLTLPAITELQPPTPILPVALPPLTTYAQLPALGAAAAPFGDSTFDNVLGYHWVTNGMLMAAQPTPAFPPLAAPPPMFAIPGAVIAAVGGFMVTGIAIDAVAGLMWLTSAPGFVVGVGAVPAMPILVPPFPIPFATGPISGLEWDSSTGSLLACDVAGIVYNFTPTGVAIGAPILPPGALPAAAQDVAIDRTLRLNGAGLRPLYVLAGPMVFDTNDPATPPFPSGSPMPRGLAFMNHPASNPPVGGCACPGGAWPKQFTTSVMTAGNAAWGVGMTGMPPFWPVLWAFDVAVFNPAFPLINGPGCPLGLLPTSATLITGGASADAAGTAILPVPLMPPLMPLGFGPFYNQNVAWCPADPVLSLVFTPTQLLHVAVP